MKELFVVMPVYNEEESITGVLHEWVPVLRSCTKDFTLCVLNDGSKDRTLQILRELEKKIPELEVIDKPNSGHGQSCIQGYRTAVERGAQYVLQLDSDGQCDPSFFPAFWAERARHDVIYGFRNRREDGIQRYVISRFVSLYALLATGIWVKDANVPYRLIKRSALEEIVRMVPPSFNLANILVAVLHQRQYGIHWINIFFRKRSGGTASGGKNVMFFVREGRRLYQQLKLAARQLDDAQAARKAVGIESARL